MPYNICSIKVSVKCMVWPGEVLQPQDASLRLDFFLTYMKTIPGS
jgi:hypothetical protein